MALIGLIMFLIIVGFSLIPFLASTDATYTDFSKIHRPPDSTNLFGTDALGRDLMTRTASGLRVSFLIGVLASVVSVFIGLIWGAIAGYKGGRTDYYMMRFVDVMYGLPFMFFVIILIVFLGRNIYNLFIALGAVQWLTMARIVRSQVLTLKRREFIESAISLGQKSSKIIYRHIIPNLLGPVFAYGFLLIPAVIIEESFLSFLGLGIQPPQASLGTLINQGASLMETQWWLLVFPGSIMILLLFSLNFLGEGLKDIFNPNK